jgi:integrase
MSMFEGVDQQELMAAFAEFFAQRQAQKQPKPTFADLWVKYEAYGSSLTDGGRTRIKSWNVTNKAHRRRLLEFFGGLAWDECTPLKAEEYRQWRRTMTTRRGGPPKAATLNREMATAQSCLSYARRMKIIPHSPLAGLQDEKVTNDRGFAITREQFLALVKYSRPMLRSFLVLLYETGMRRDELRCLEWHEVDLDLGMITLPAHRTKANKEREIPLTTAARLTLDMLPADGVNPYVFASPFRPTGPINRATLGDWFVDAREAANVTGPKGQPIWLHTLRHTWATDNATAGLDIETLMSIGGWSDHKVASKYMNIARRHRQAGLVKMNERSVSLVKALDKGPKPPRKAPAAAPVVVPEEEEDLQTGA